MTGIVSLRPYNPKFGGMTIFPGTLVGKLLAVFETARKKNDIDSACNIALQSLKLKGEPQEKAKKWLLDHALVLKAREAGHDVIDVKEARKVLAPPLKEKKEDSGVSKKDHTDEVKSTPPVQSEPEETIDERLITINASDKRSLIETKTGLLKENTVYNVKINGKQNEEFTGLLSSKGKDGNLLTILNFNPILDSTESKQIRTVRVSNGEINTMSFEVETSEKAKQLQAKVKMAETIGVPKRYRETSERRDFRKNRWGRNPVRNNWQSISIPANRPPCIDDANQTKTQSEKNLTLTQRAANYKTVAALRELIGKTFHVKQEDAGIEFTAKLDLAINLVPGACLAFIGEAVLNTVNGDITLELVSDNTTQVTENPDLIVVSASRDESTASKNKFKSLQIGEQYEVVEQNGTKRHFVGKFEEFSEAGDDFSVKFFTESSDRYEYLDWCLDFEKFQGTIKKVNLSPIKDEPKKENPKIVLGWRENPEGKLIPGRYYKAHDYLGTEHTDGGSEYLGYIEDCDRFFHLQFEVKDKSGYTFRIPLSSTYTFEEINFT